VLSYPASCEKLAYLAAAIHWCTERGREPECLDADVRPMIEQSDNVATGRVVDAISGATNVAWAPAADVPLPSGVARPAPSTTSAVLRPPGFDAWLESRRYAERVLESRGLLGDQRLLHKTWPTNSGDEPAGAERLALAVAGRNAMTSDGAARLMLALQTGALVPEGREYARSLLRRARWSAQAAYGSGLPPGTGYYAKIGSAYDTLEEIAWLELPDRRRLVVAAFSNGWDQQEPPPLDVARLGSFVEELVAMLDDGAAVHATDRAGSTRVRGASSASHLPWSTVSLARPAGSWQRLEARSARAAGAAWVTATPGASYEWRVAVPRAGRYEIAVWYPSAPDQTPAARYDLAGGEVPVWLDQRHWGGRWLPLGEVDAVSGSVSVRVSSDAEDGRLVADAIRVTAVARN
jgi:protein phosphatase methylesterase 1